ncbi:hypothetical protein [Kitasatospora kifunensis]|uniref:DUF4245 domain-containing protein n=1 Tax=Kitasatospora kifunensis TaxID=58351 RepID=A0A7W7R9D7_KITKI|nr:hypothetical protein [Kitasatospora kifunensis]MBB4927862.1 hypothetical protein [Kitasatospora kifunensis]
MATGDAGRAQSGGGALTGVLILVVLATLIGLLFVTNDHTDARGTGYDPVTIDLPRTVEHEHQLGSSVNLLNEPDDTVARLASSGLSDLSQGVYGDSPGSAGIWVVTTSRNDRGQVGTWLAANAPSGPDSTVTHPHLAIAGNTTCYQKQRDDRSMCTWYDENYFLMVTGPTDPGTVQQVLLRVHDGTES